MYIRWVYADTDDRRRNLNWETIRSIDRGGTNAWICQGDFNTLTHQHEKDGGRPKSHRQMDAFRDFINDIEAKK